MRNIVLLCAAGLSSVMLVERMREEASKHDIVCEIQAYTIGDANKVIPNADIVLLGPQVKMFVKKIKDMYPDKPIYVISQRIYGTRDGAKLLQEALLNLE